MTTFWGMQPDEVILVAAGLLGTPFLIVAGAILAAELGRLAHAVFLLLGELLALVLRPVVWLLEWGLGLTVWPVLLLGRGLGALVRRGRRPSLRTVAPTMPGGVVWAVPSGSLPLGPVHPETPGGGVGVEASLSGRSRSWSGLGGIPGGVAVGACDECVPPRSECDERSVGVVRDETVRRDESPARVTPSERAETLPGACDETPWDARPTPVGSVRDESRPPGKTRRDETPAGRFITVCVGCGRPVPVPPTGRPRRFCSAACRQRAWRARRGH